MWFLYSRHLGAIEFLSLSMLPNDTSYRNNSHSYTYFMCLLKKIFSQLKGVLKKYCMGPPRFKSTHLDLVLVVLVDARLPLDVVDEQVVGVDEYGRVVVLEGLVGSDHGLEERLPDGKI